MSSIVLTGSSAWALAAADFSNPSYLSAPAGFSVADPSVGFDISGSETVSIAFEGTFSGQTAVHQQTMDSTGASGWFTVGGTPGDGQGAVTSAGSTSGKCYIFGSVGVRHRIKLTALATGTIQARISLTAQGVYGVTALTVSSGSNAQQVQGTAADGAAASGNPVQTGGVDGSGNVQALLVDTSGQLLVTAGQATAANLNATVVGTGTFAVQAAQSGTWDIGNVTGTITLPTGAATAAKQPAFGVSGTASADVITVQGISGMTALAVSQPTAANLNATIVGLGTAGTPSGGVLTVQGVTSGTPLIIGGIVASGAADSGNPVKVGAVYNSTFPTFTTGQRGDVQIDSRGNLRMTITNGDGITPAVVGTAANSMVLTGSLRTSAINMVYNGTNMDLAKSVVDATNTTGTGIMAAGILGQFNDVSPQSITENQFGNIRVTSTGELVIGGQVSGGTTTKALQVDSNGVVATSSAAVSTGGYSYVHIAAGQATTTVKSGAGTLHAIIFNSAATATNVTTIYDSTTGSGTVIGIPAATTATIPTTLIFDLAFATGLTILTATANGSDMTVVYK